MVSSVAVVRCGSYEDDRVSSSVSKALTLIGGISRFVGEGDRVLLKVNLLSASDPGKAITTHPSVVKAVVRQVQAAGGVPVIGDSPGGRFTRGSLANAYEKSGMKEVAAETGAHLNYNTGSMQVSNPGGKLIKRLDLIKALDEVDVVITLPKMKTHMYTRFTGATKILFGVVPGLTKPVYHAKLSDVGRFSDMLLDLLEYVKPELSIMDAVVGLEGDGPGTQGTPREADLILASADSIALDVVATSLIGMNPLDVPILKRACERGLTSCKLEDIDVLGEGIEDVSVRFKTPESTSGLLGKVMSNPMFRRLSLTFTVAYPIANDNCVRCGVCAENCPVDAISISERAHMDLGKCIRCYCCHELCPHEAIDLKTGFFRRLIK
jgi:uncharacterized protein (DUF362 family)/NAD-dependent dihydropyrimidine dehydrogenase PreA subunit